MSALPPKADMCSALGHVRFVPIADSRTAANSISIRSFYQRRSAARQAVGVGGSAPAQSFFAVLTHLANMVLGIKLKAKLGNEVELGFEEIDVVLLVRHQQFEQIARHIIPG
jgi:hypothetical protein